MSSFQYNANLGNPPPISFGSFTQRSERDMMGPAERYKFDQRPVVKKEIPADNVPQVPLGPDATTLADQLGSFGVELFSGAYLGQLALTVGDKIDNFMRIMPDDPALEHIVNFTDDDSRAGRGLEGINTRSHIIKRLEDAGIPPDMWPDIVGDDPDEPKTYAEFEGDLDDAILKNPEFVKGYGGSAGGLVAGIGVDAVGLFTSGELLGVPVAAAVGNAVAPAGVSVALNAVRGAVGWGASSALQTALYQSIREGVNPYSRPDIADLLLEQGLAIGIGAGIGGLTGAVQPVLRGTVEDVPVATVVDNTAIVSVGGAAGRRGSIRVTPEPPAGLLPGPAGRPPVEYRLRLTGRYGEVAWNGMDQAPMRASTAGMLERLDDVADEAFSLHAANRARGTNIVTDTLDAIRDAGGTTDTFLARAVARSAFLRYANGERGEALANGVLDDIRGAIGDDVLGRMRAPAQPTGVSQTTALARRQSFNTDVPVLSDKLPSRGPILDLVDIVNDPEKAKALTRHSGSATILTSIRKATGVDITVRKADEVLSDLTELVRSTAQDIRKGIRNILAKHAPGQKISVTNALVRQIQALRGGLNNQTNATQMATATVPSVSAQGTGANTGTAPSGVLPGASAMTTAVPPVPPAPTPPPPPPVPPAPTNQQDIVRNLNDAIPFITWTQGGTFMLNQSAAALRDDNPLVRMVGLLANARRILQTPGGGDVQQEFTILEEGTHNLNRFLVEMNDIMRRRRRQWRMGGDTNSRTLIERHLMNEIGQVATLQGTGKRQFHQQIIANVRSGAAFPGSTNPIEVASDEVRDWMHRLYDEAHALGIPGFRGQWDPKYFPRVWDWDALVAVSADGQNRAALIRWAEQELATTDVNGVPARQVIWEDGTVDVYTDVPEAAVAFVNALQDIATAANAETNNMTRQSHVWEWEGELINALNNIAGPLRAGTPARTTSVHGRPRTILRETTVMNLPNPVRYNLGRSNFGRGRTLNNISIANLTSDDLPYVMRKYAISIQAAINEHRALQMFNATLDNHGLRGPGGAPIVLESVGQIVGQANRLARDFPNLVGGALSRTRIEIVNHILDALRYRPIMDLQRMGSVGKSFEEAGSFVHSAVYLASGGGFGVTAIPEIVRSASMFGFRNFLRNAPHVAIQYARGWRNMDDPTRGMIAAIQALTNPSVDRKLKQLYFAGASDESLKFGNISRTLGNKVGSAFADVTGLAPITSLYQGMTNMMTLTHLVDVGAGRVRPLDSGTIKLLGLSQDQYDTLTRWAHRNVVMGRGLVFEHPVNINNTNDPEFFQMIGFLDRSVRHNIQDVPTATDFNRFFFSGFGQLLTTFRKFSIKGVDNFMFGNLSRMRFGDIRSRLKVIRTMFAVGLVGGMLWYGRRVLEHAQAIDNRDYKRAREIEGKFLNQEAFTRAAVDSMTEFWLPVTIGDTAYRALYSNENFMSNYDPNLVNINNLPQAQWLMNAASVARDVQGQGAETAREALSLHPTFKLLDGIGLVPNLPENSRQFTVDSARKSWRLMPGNNIPYFGDYIKEKFIIGPMRDAYYPESQYREPSAAQQRKTTKGYIR